jgi:hypothetical protein
MFSIEKVGEPLGRRDVSQRLLSGCRLPLKEEEKSQQSSRANKLSNVLPPSSAASKQSIRAAAMH